MRAFQDHNPGAEPGLPLWKINDIQISDEYYQKSAHIYRWRIQWPKLNGCLKSPGKQWPSGTGWSRSCWPPSPLMGLVALLVWSFDEGRQPTKSTWAKATLIWYVISTIIAVLILLIALGMRLRWFTLLLIESCSGTVKTGEIDHSEINPVESATLLLQRILPRDRSVDFVIEEIDAAKWLFPAHWALPRPLVHNLRFSKHPEAPAPRPLNTKGWFRTAAPFLYKIQKILNFSFPETSHLKRFKRNVSTFRMIFRRNSLTDFNPNFTQRAWGLKKTHGNWPGNSKLRAGTYFIDLNRTIHYF